MSTSLCAFRRILRNVSFRGGSVPAQGFVEPGAHNGNFLVDCWPGCAPPSFTISLASWPLRLQRLHHDFRLLQLDHVVRVAVDEEHADRCRRRGAPGRVPSPFRQFLPSSDRRIHRRRRSAPAARRARWPTPPGEVRGRKKTAPPGRGCRTARAARCRSRPLGVTAAMVAR